MSRQRAFLMTLVALVLGVALGVTAVALLRPQSPTTAKLPPSPSPSVSPAASIAPSARSWPSMAFDATTEEVVLFGGSGPGETYLADTWTWSRAGWRQQHPPVSPPARRAAAMVYDPVSRQVLMWGGQGVNGAGADFWGWDGSSWSQIRVTAGPPPDDNLGWPTPAPVLVWDSTRNVVELIRNNGSHPDAPKSPDVWSWDESKWTQETSQGAPVAWGTAAFDAHIGRTLFYATGPSMQPQTYLYASTGWTRSSAAITPPVQLDNPPPLVYFTPAGRTVAVEPNGDTWSFDGVEWAQTGSGSLPNLSGYAIAYDASAHAIVLFGGSQTWTWDGASWSRV